MKETIFTGQWVEGAGKAHKVTQTLPRKKLFEKLFNCHLYGTFNIKTNKSNMQTPPYIKEDIHKFYPIKITLKNGKSEIGLAYRWEGSSLPANKMEVYFKKIISNEFKEQPLQIKFLKKWNNNQIFRWQQDKYWFQGFEWLAPKNKRADSELVWKHIQNENYMNKTILDFGCHYGYFSMKAAKKGAIVTGIDKKHIDIRMANIINENIELTDANFIVADNLPEQKFDYVFELSVYHWMDEPYTKLDEHIKLLKSKTKIAVFLEIINPPLKKNLTKEQVDKIVVQNGGKELLHYQHKIRKTRTIYRIGI